MYQVFQYLKFLISSKNAHGVHSPFVYTLLTNCLYDTEPVSTYQKIHDYRQRLLKNNRQLEIEDLGAGSRVHKSKSRSIRQLAKSAGSSLKQAKLLYRLTAYFKPKNILELGTSLGISTYALALANKEARLVTVEGSRQIADTAKEQLNDLADNIDFKTSSFDKYLSTNSERQWDLIYIDGNHTKIDTIDMFERLLNNCHSGTLMILDDIYWSKGMTEAWEYIKNSDRVSLTIDTFFKGLVFFKAELSKENFKLRI